jgi:tRNA(Leu) C34 or U34 (ribose-2'-O)-methylase TrmL
MVNIGLINPKSASNVAVILRAAGCYGAKAIYYTGKRYEYARAFNEDTKNVHQSVPTIAVDDLLNAIPADAKSVVIELVEGAVPLPEFSHPNQAFYIFGPEDGTVSQSIIDAADHVVYVPTNNSMNLAATANVVLYDRMAKSDYARGDELIRKSRDTNNQAKIS